MQTRRFLRRPEVLKKTGLSASTIQRLERAGNFPARRVLSPHCVAWFEDELDAWLEQRALVGTPQATSVRSPSTSVTSSGG
ncbi:helix-turn-helix transcriptional regulator [Paraburkholderia aspalathi]|uniref:helix-turn-helix transcriptional regulator n=1 Tax=Paraburkholderia aspalathi TaxID=1324617 RepID=UPI001B2E6FB3|nr:hypothetical protein R20943_06438 [Paraburkholderia aspalathi]